MERNTFSSFKNLISNSLLLALYFSIHSIISSIFNLFICLSLIEYILLFISILYFFVVFNLNKNVLIFKFSKL